MSVTSIACQLGLRTTAGDLWVVAQTVWGEARGEAFAGQCAVAQVIRNRQQVHPRWQGWGLAAICKASFQFSCWNPGSSVLPALRTVNLDTVAFSDCLCAATQVLAGIAANQVGDSTHYYAVGTPVPFWAVGKPLYAQLGNHLFFAHIA